MIIEGPDAMSGHEQLTWERIFEREGPARIADGKGKTVDASVEDGSAVVPLRRGTAVWRLWQLVREERGALARGQLEGQVFVAFVTLAKKRVTMKQFAGRFMEVGWVPAAEIRGP